MEDQAQEPARALTRLLVVAEETAAQLVIRYLVKALVKDHLAAQRALRALRDPQGPQAIHLELLEPRRVEIRFSSPTTGRMRSLTI